MSCYKWELEAVLEGLALKNVDDLENLASLAAMVRYTIHSKKIKASKLFDKRKEERKVKSRSTEHGSAQGRNVVPDLLTPPSA